MPITVNWTKENSLFQKNFPNCRQKIEHNKSISTGVQYVISATVKKTNWMKKSKKNAGLDKRIIPKKNPAKLHF
jgi:hypothetical protein